MELVLLVLAAVGITISVFGKYVYEQIRRKSAIGLPSLTPFTDCAVPRYVLIDARRSTTRTPRSRRRCRPMRKSD